MSDVGIIGKEQVFAEGEEALGKITTARRLKWFG